MPNLLIKKSKGKAKHEVIDDFYDEIGAKNQEKGYGAEENVKFCFFHHLIMKNFFPEIVKVEVSRILGPQIHASEDSDFNPDCQEHYETREQPEHEAEIESLQNRRLVHHVESNSACQGDIEYGGIGKPPYVFIVFFRKEQDDTIDMQQEV